MKKSKLNKSIISHYSFELRSADRLSAPRHKKSIFLSFNVSIFHILYVIHKSHNIIYAIGYVHLQVLKNIGSIIEP